MSLNFLQEGHAAVPLTINCCRFFIVNGSNIEKITLLEDARLTSGDEVIGLPFKSVYKLAGVIDNNIRYVKQPNGTILLFNMAEWESRKKKKRWLNL